MYPTLISYQIQLPNAMTDDVTRKVDNYSADLEIGTYNSLTVFTKICQRTLSGASSIHSINNKTVLIH
jgi:hypothetical protein